MKITSIKLTKHLMPGGSCGTGYTEPDYFKVTCDDGLDYQVMIDIWCRPITSVKPEFLTVIGKKLPNVTNINDAWEMYVSEIAEKTCPWTVQELLNTYTK